MIPENEMTSKREVLLNKAFSLIKRATPEQMDLIMTYLDLLAHHPGFKE